ncbi:23S rRNA (cytidine1920-2'-O)/16S rRNA (cytidine1409-2'-O)-methyltransferase [Mesorhizobium sp. J18]|uniref:TlyA family RNA methyltransferase n=1 Tax=Mesorhizobium sp. J18 TaxID=935263 RepID=UPI00119A4AC7|nr:TlyA family RNA methyltransferase [Mesorhizobium sp. J18]TWG89642.1 23S rRNA (cytidine1920-2'-O)/16S rRNA (cytidine1409-2'-O)-methyltransferase [Mesorhizobium sp. J18]
MAAETADSNRIRLDHLLVERGFFASRARARDAILRGTVSVGGMPASKPGQRTPLDATVSVDDPARKYVSRAALKLVHALDAFGLEPRGRHALDLGASTGGFTQVLLERGAAHVTAVDVGHGQMGAGLRADPRVTCVEGVNARDLTPADLGGAAPGFIVSDVSFISLKLALPPALALAAPGAHGIFLVKPQFEAGREAIGKGGILRDLRHGRRVAEEMAVWLGTNAGWHALGVKDSPIDGGDGNREYLLAGAKAT